MIVDPGIILMLVGYSSCNAFTIRVAAENPCGAGDKSEKTIQYTKSKLINQVTGIIIFPMSGIIFLNRQKKILSNKLKGFSIEV